MFGSNGKTPNHPDPQFEQPWINDDEIKYSEEENVDKNHIPGANKNPNTWSDLSEEKKEKVSEKWDVLEEEEPSPRNLLTLSVKSLPKSSVESAKKENPRSRKFGRVSVKSV